MSPSEWYRHRTWSAEDKSAFMATLNKSRGPFHKAQYARIQAYELHHNGGKQYAHAALELLDMILEKWKGAAELAAVYHQQAECFRDLLQDESAITAYRAAFEQQRHNPGYITTAHLDFAWWVATSPKPELFDEAFRALDDFFHGTDFPIAIYMAEGARALMQHSLNNHEAARKHACRALEAAKARQSGFRHHPKLGLVGKRDNTVHELLLKLAAG